MTADHGATSAQDDNSKRAEEVGASPWTAEAVAELFQVHRERLLKCVANWTPANMRQKFSPDDVLQDAVIAAIRTPQRIATLEVLPFVWFRSLARESLTQRLRSYLGTARRDAQREVPLDNAPLDSETSRRLTIALADSGESPSSALRHRESVVPIQNALEKAFRGRSGNHPAVVF